MNKHRIKGAARAAIFTYFDSTRRWASRSSHFMRLARMTSMKYKVPFTKEQKALYCKNCGAYLIPGKNARVRVHRGRVIRLCLECKNFRRVSIR